jgi:hypothetical protein
MPFQPVSSYLLPIFLLIGSNVFITTAERFAGNCILGQGLAAKAKKSLSHTASLLEADFDAISKTKLTMIAHALGETEQRLKALEEVVEELAAGANLKTVRGTMASSHYVAKLLGKHPA